MQCGPHGPPWLPFVLLILQLSVVSADADSGCVRTNLSDELKGIGSDRRHASHVLEDSDSRTLFQAVLPKRHGGPDFKIPAKHMDSRLMIKENKGHLISSVVLVSAEELAPVDLQSGSAVTRVLHSWLPLAMDVYWQFISQQGLF